ncbi:uncharacterized protein MONOS_2747 [Monocercomonoides exilis]|uniref:uncharacterized protein n=1 Tax=Monocercomonoides exilis TaxID=2049356 RepID=UPI00355AA21A|nr:hypothetical protein MONOS_2747 [Monocercomonoides exilis]|eukprot:MONOS_2747.1-p1 / transcript=MONOS_2747.1 / gene=MONOS_2747 / organism=Monocercomonoides_exilis_PA203 / gene_product=unspecified product / transcript_product=unspecified product / location=Mono_scaffold00058:97270-109619(-) / protein_length=4054 / sequence_SO=supercontig / SO=protein_coding / is_pseudo=false
MVLAVEDLQQSLFAMNDGDCICLVNFSLLSAFDCQLHSLVLNPPRSLSNPANCELSVCSCAFASFGVVDPPFLAPSTCSQVLLSHCALANITGSARGCDCRTMKAQISQDMLSCSFEGVEDVFYDGIVSSINSPHTASLHSLNNTFNRNMRKSNLNEQYIGTGVNRSISCSFMNDTFTNCISEIEGDEIANGGAAISIRGYSSELDVESCTFINSTAKYHSTILASNIKSISVNNSLIINGTANPYHVGGIMCYGPFSEGVSTSHCVFMNNNASRIAALYYYRQNASTLNTLSVIDCDFENNIARDAYAGAFGTRDGLIGIFRMSECKFVNNKAKYGGALYFEAYTPPADNPKPKFMLFCHFHNNVASDKQGHDLYFVPLVLTDTPFEQSSSTNRQNRVFYNNSATGYDFWLAYPVRYVHASNGSDGAGCGEEEVEGERCATIHYALQELKNPYGGDIVLLPSAFNPNEALVLSGMVVNVCGKGSEKPGIAVPAGVGGPFVDISGGLVNVSSVAITKSTNEQISLVRVGDSGLLVFSKAEIACNCAPQTEYVESVFVVEDGVLVLELSTISSFVLKGKPLVEWAASGQVRVADSVFRDISRVEGDGSVFEKRLGRQEVVELGNVSFERCMCGKGNGGAVAVWLGEESGVAIGNNSCVRFDGCSVGAEGEQKGKGGGVYVKAVEGGGQAGQAGQSGWFVFGREVVFSGCEGWRGKNVFVDVKNLNWSVSVSSMQFEVKFEAENHKELMGFEGGDESYAIPLCLYLQEFGGPGFVGGANSRDFSGCGYRGYGCSTLAHIAQLRFGGLNKNIVLEEGFVWEEKVEMEREEWAVGCEQEHTLIGMGQITSSGAGGDGVIVSEKRNTLSNIVFRMGSGVGVGVASVVVCRGSMLTMAGCGVQKQQEDTVFGCVFVRVEKGTVNVSSFAVSGIRFGSGCLVGVEGEHSKCVMDGLACTNTTTGGAGGVIGVSLCGSLTLQNSNISDVSQAQSPFVKAGVLSTMQVMNCSFVSMQRSSGNGSCVDVECGDGECVEGENGRMVVMENTWFEGCSVGGASEGGGALALSMGKCTQLRVTGCTFVGCAAPTGSMHGLGGGMLVRFAGEAAPFVVSDPVFSADNPNEASFGHDLFIEAPRLRSVATAQTLPFAVESPLTAVHAFEGYDGSDKAHAIPLIFFVREMGSTAHADSAAGLDVDACGFAAYPCHTLSQAVRRLSGWPKRVEVAGPFAMEEALGLSDPADLQIGGAAPGAECTVIGKESGGEGLVVLSGELPSSTAAFSSLCFVLPLSIKQHRSLFCQASQGTLAVSSASFIPHQSAASHTFTLFTALSGRVVVEDVVWQGIRLIDTQCANMSGTSVLVMGNVSFVETWTSSPKGLVWVWSAGAAASMEDARFELASQEHPCQAVHSDQALSLEIANTSFINQSRNTGHGSCVECTVKSEQTLAIQGCSFEMCSATDGNGGGVCVAMEAGGTAKITSSEGSATASAAAPSTFTKCTSHRGGAGSGGFGGGLFGVLQEGAVDFVVGGVAFSGCTADSGNNLFLQAKQLASVANNRTLGFVFDIAEGVADLNDLCGCSTDTAGTQAPIPLVVFFRAPPAERCVADGGADNAVCGFSDYPCETIAQAASPLVAQQSVAIKILSPFTLKDEVHLEVCPTVISAGEVGGTMGVVNGGRGEQAGLIETSCEVAFVSVCFAHPAVLTNRKALIVCNGGVLGLSSCQSVLQATAGLKCGFAIVRVVRGSLSMSSFEIRGTPFGVVGPFVFEGDAQEIEKAAIHNLTLEDVATESESGALSVSRVGVWKLGNSTISNSAQQYCPVVAMSEVGSSEVSNVTFENLNRHTGFGGVVSCAIGASQTARFERCTFVSCEIMSASMKGGSVFASVEQTGTFVFDTNKVSSSGVDGDSGLGGGLYVSMLGRTSAISMKSNTFVANRAWKGRHLYLECPSPRNTIRPLDFEDSFDAEMEDDELWVHDGSSGAVVDETLKRYLFSSSEEIVVVDKASGSDTPTCGSDLFPCESVSEGYLRMGTKQTTILVVSSAALATEIRRDNQALTIAGRNTTSLLVLGAGGHLVVSPSEALVTLTIHKLVLSMPAELSHTEAVLVGEGTLLMRQCEFRAADEEQSHTGTGAWALCIRGGKAQLDAVGVRGMCFAASGGFVWMCGGSAHLTRISVESVSAGGAGLVVGEGSGALELKASSFEDCVLNGGSTLSIGSGVDAELSGSCSWSRCRSSAGNGAALRCSLAGSQKLNMSDCSFQECVLDGNINGKGNGNYNDNSERKGKGGGIFLGIDQSSTNSFKLSHLTFGGNEAAFGNNLFLKCADLNTTATPARLVDLISSGDAPHDLEGTDERLFSGGVHDLRLFLQQRQASSSCIFPSGFDILGCGSEAYPCASLWRGMLNINPGSADKTLSIKASALIQNEFDLTSSTVASSSSTEKATITFASAILDSTRSCVVLSTGRLSFNRLDFSVAGGAFLRHSELISSSTPQGQLLFGNCSFAPAGTPQIEGTLVRAEGGSVQMEGCVFGAFAPSSSLLCINGSLEMNTTAFQGSRALGCDAGGLVGVSLGSGCHLSAAGCEFSHGECNKKTGRGGALYVKSTEADAAGQPFLLEAVTFASNDAAKGRNIYVDCFDINASVTPATFHFPYEPFVDDPNALVGSDQTFVDADLFRFLVPYTSSEIHLSNAGFDIARCGSPNDPCRSFVTGFEHIDASAAHKTISIGCSTAISRPADLSNFTCQSLPSEEAARSVLLFQEDSQGSNPFLLNSWSLSLSGISLQAVNGFSNEVSAIILNKQGSLALDKCAFEPHTSVAELGAYSFAVVEAGSLTCTQFESTNAHLVCSMFLLHAGSAGTFDAIHISSCSLSNCSLVEAASSTNRSPNSPSSISIFRSTLVDIVQTANKSCVVWSRGEGVVKVVVNETDVEGCRSSSTEKGGAVHYLLSSGGRLACVNSTLMQCSCSTGTGMGGGVYLETSMDGELGFLFQKMEFDSNAARHGRDIFVVCRNISGQINETQFRFDLREGVYNRINAICGLDDLSEGVVDLISFITTYQAAVVFVSSAGGEAGGGSNSRQCGSARQPCASIGYGLGHVVIEYGSAVVVESVGLLECEADFENISLTSKTSKMAVVSFSEPIVQTRDALVEAAGRVNVEGIQLAPGRDLSLTHSFVFSAANAEFQMISSAICPAEESSPSSLPSLPSLPTLIMCSSGECTIEKCAVRSVGFRSFFVGVDCFLSVNRLSLSSVELGQRCFDLSQGTKGFVLHEVSFEEIRAESTLVVVEKMSGKVLADNEGSDEMSLSLIQFSNISVQSDASAAVSLISLENPVVMQNCSFVGCQSHAERGSAGSILRCSAARVCTCLFDGSTGGSSSSLSSSGAAGGAEELCGWNGSVVDAEQSEVAMADTTVANSAEGGLSVSGGCVSAEAANFTGNAPSIPNYQSARRNVLCKANGKLVLVSVKGGDGMLPDSSLWISSEGCELGGLASDRASPLFIPQLTNVTMAQTGTTTQLVFCGALLLPCNLLFKVVTALGDEEAVEKYEFPESGFVSETEAHGAIPSSILEGSPDEAEVTVSILFGPIRSASTSSVVLKNRSKSQTSGDGIVVETVKEKEIAWPFIVCIVIVVILLIALIVFIVRWSKQKRRAEELEVIVEDTVKKDPKAFEMITMEMSPEEQWRRAEREAEKKNEERIKKMVYEKSLGHSESSEHLLSESGSTEYILGRDSDKIPDWALEKEEEEEETRKRTPSPSISSTSTTDTSDTDTTFVRPESMCPTTSSMSNLVDAMACSSPHEKLIVDLRDSLFMLLHGRNEKKEMAIGTLQEREVTAAQILFWVANGALHSFDEMENKLQSLANLSPHIVLFSEHMVICIAMHSDCSSSDDSYSSSISSSTIVTSSSDGSRRSKRYTRTPPPSSAFEDDEDNRNECLRWKAPELMNGAKKHATKKTVAFSIGMMLWECLTLDVPFGEYEAVIAGKKIASGERPNLKLVRGSDFAEFVEALLWYDWQKRPSLEGVKRELLGRMPAGAVMFTASDAISLEESASEEKRSTVEISSRAREEAQRLLKELTA